MDNLNWKEGVDALHAASSEILRRSNELSSNYWRSYVTVIHLMQVKSDTKKQMPQQIDSAVNSKRLDLVKIKGIATT